MNCRLLFKAGFKEFLFGHLRENVWFFGTDDEFLVGKKKENEKKEN